MRRMPTMSIRKSAVWLVAIATAATATLALASPAHAATIVVNPTCSGGVLSVTSNEIVAIPGDIIVVQNTTGVGRTLDVLGLTGFTNNTDIAGIANGSQSRNMVVQSATGSFDLLGAGGTPACTTGTTVTFGPGTSSVSLTPLPPPPPPVLQQFGRPASDTCDAAAPATLNWAGVAGNGWTPSWSEWMNGGRGGAVCTRTLVYNTQQARWTIG